MLVLKHHRNLSESRWRDFGFDRQVLMVANELNRAGHSLERSDPEEARVSYERALELIQLTLCVARGASRLRELARAKEVIAGLYLEENPCPKQNLVLQSLLVGLSPKAYSMLNPVSI